MKRSEVEWALTRISDKLYDVGQWDDDIIDDIVLIEAALELVDYEDDD